tara:strand:- start:351 stop:635 length:285 start_codon:yes stop_codon:yes gene_type:complete
MVRYKQLCYRCKKNYVEVRRWNEKYVLCYDCQKSELNKPIKDAKMKRMFNIPEEFYKENPFLRSIKSNYLRFGKLSDRQIEAFKETVKKMKKAK